jgi:hypothetical protein
MLSLFVFGALGYLFVLQSHPNWSAISFASALVAYNRLS